MGCASSKSGGHGRGDDQEESRQPRLCWQSQCFEAADTKSLELLIQTVQYHRVSGANLLALSRPHSRRGVLVSGSAPALCSNGGRQRLHFGLGLNLVNQEPTNVEESFLETLADHNDQRGLGYVLSCLSHSPGIPEQTEVFKALAMVCHNSLVRTVTSKSAMGGNQRSMPWKVIERLLTRCQSVLERKVPVGLFDGEKVFGTLMHTACLSNDAELVAALAAACPSLVAACTKSTGQWSDWTPLHLAGLLGYTDCAAVLLQAGSPASSLTCTGHSCLHVALLAPTTDVELVHKLIRGGAAIDLLNQHGNSPHDIATSRGRLDLCAILQQAGSVRQLDHSSSYQRRFAAAEVAESPGSRGVPDAFSSDGSSASSRVVDSRRSARRTNSGAQRVGAPPLAPPPLDESNLSPFSSVQTPPPTASAQYASLNGWLAKPSPPTRPAMPTLLSESPHTSQSTAAPPRPTPPLPPSSGSHGQQRGGHAAAPPPSIITDFDTANGSRPPVHGGYKDSAHGSGDAGLSPVASASAGTPSGGMPPPTGPVAGRAYVHLSRSRPHVSQVTRSGGGGGGATSGGRPPTPDGAAPPGSASPGSKPAQMGWAAISEQLSASGAGANSIRNTRLRSTDVAFKNMRGMFNSGESIVEDGGGDASVHSSRTGLPLGYGEVLGPRPASRGSEAEEQPASLTRLYAEG